MTELVEYSLPDGGTVTVEAVYPPAEAGRRFDEPAMRGWRDKASDGGSGAAGQAAATAGRAFEQALASVGPATQALARTLRSGPEGPDEIEVEFGLQMTARADAFITQIGGSANFKVTLRWRRPVDGSAVDSAG